MENYIVMAWYVFMQVIGFMQETTILSVGGVNVTFLGLAVAIMIFSIAHAVIYTLLIGD